MKRNYFRVPFVNLGGNLSKGIIPVEEIQLDVQFNEGTDFPLDVLVLDGQALAEKTKWYQGQASKNGLIAKTGRFEGRAAHHDVNGAAAESISNTLSKGLVDELLKAGWVVCGAYVLRNKDKDGNPKRPIFRLVLRRHDDPLLPTIQASYGTTVSQETIDLFRELTSRYYYDVTIWDNRVAYSDDPFLYKNVCIKFNLWHDLGQKDPYHDLVLTGNGHLQFLEVPSPNVSGEGVVVASF